MPMTATLKLRRLRNRLDCATFVSWWGNERDYRERPAARSYGSRKGKKSIYLAKTQLQVGRLEAHIARMRVELERKPTLTPITSLAPRPFQVLQPIYAVVREDGGAFVASFADANINASGDTRSEALEILKDSLAARFRFFAESEAELGDEPQRQLSVLREFLRAR
jgi:hypothetical protein